MTVLTTSSSGEIQNLAPEVTVKKHEDIASETGCDLLVVPRVIGDFDLLHKCLSALVETGYLLVRESPKTSINIPSGFTQLLDYEYQGERILLLHRTPKLNTHTEVIKVTDYNNFTWIPVAKRLIADETVQDVVLVSEKNFATGLLGFTLCLRKEKDGNKARCVLIQDDKAPPFDLSTPLYRDQVAKGLVQNVYRDGCWGMYFQLALPTDRVVAPVEHAFVGVTQTGDLSSLKLLEGPLKHNKKSTNISVYYSALNFKDIMLASGRLQTYIEQEDRLHRDMKIGLEFAGRDSSGRRVFGMIKQGAMSTLLDSDDCLAWSVPDNWTLEDAVTVPIVYGTAYLGLVEKARLKAGETVLIHSGAGGVGLAAINIALHFGCTVYITVGSPEKKEFIKKTYPKYIKDRQIGNSRDTSFENWIMDETKGRGVDVILNSLSEDKLAASVRCLAKHGRFLEIGKYDASKHHMLGLDTFLKGTCYQGVMLDLIFDETKESKQRFVEAFGSFLKSGCVTPLPRTAFDIQNVEDAFRYMAGGRHIGKIVLKVREEESSKVVVPKPLSLPAIRRWYWSTEGSYLIIGGLGGFALEMCDLMVLRGVRRLVLAGRGGIKTGYQAQRIRTWRSYGAKVVVASEDITSLEGVTNLVKAASALGTVHGIYNLAITANDDYFMNQNPKDFEYSCTTKLTPTVLLDKVSRELCPELKEFVMFSSISCSRGHFMQTTYGYANSGMERVCEKRRLEGYPALALQWGPIGDVGIMAEYQAMERMKQGRGKGNIVVQGFNQQPIAMCLEAFDRFMFMDHCIIETGILCSKAVNEGDSKQTLVDAVLKIMGIKDIKNVSLNVTLPELGLDSMMVVELKQMLDNEYQLNFTPQDMRKLTFSRIMEIQESNKNKSSEGKDETGDGKLTEEEAARLKVVLMGTTQLAGQSPVFLVPGMDGVSSLFLDLAQNLALPAVCLQYPYNQTLSTVQEVALELLKELKPRLDGPKFTIVTNHTGCFVALEMAWMLESEGRDGVIVMVGGTPDSTQENLNAVLQDGSERNMHTLILYHILNERVKMKNKEDRVREIITSDRSFQDKLKFIISVMPEPLRPDFNFQLIAADDLMKRSKAMLAYKYEHETKLRSKLILIKPKEHIMQSKLPHDFNLSKYCRSGSQVHVVDGVIHNIIDSPVTAAIIKDALL